MPYPCNKNCPYKGRYRIPVHRYQQDPKAESYGGEAADQAGLDPARVFKNSCWPVTETAELLWLSWPVKRHADLRSMASAAKVKEDWPWPTRCRRSAVTAICSAVSATSQKKALRNFIDSSAQQWPTLYGQRRPSWSGKRTGPQSYSRGPDPANLLASRFGIIGPSTVNNHHNKDCAQWRSTFSPSTRYH